LNNASVRRVGGLARVNEGIGFLENSYTLASLDKFTLLSMRMLQRVQTGTTRL
jgi:hypothetical protein